MAAASEPMEEEFTGMAGPLLISRLEASLFNVQVLTARETGYQHPISKNSWRQVLIRLKV